jgi:hypothetical protein
MVLFSTGYARVRPHGQALRAMTQNPTAVFGLRLFRKWEVERAIEANAFAIVFTGVLMAAVLPTLWLFLPTSVGLFLFQNAAKGWCLPIVVTRRMGIPTSYGIENEVQVVKVRGGDFANVHQPSDEFAPALAARCP